MRIGVIVLDCGHADSEAAARSARAGGLDVRVLIVENGGAPRSAGGTDRLRLAENRGFAGGVNAGLTQLSAQGCDCFLLLNDDAVLEPGCLPKLAQALEDGTWAAVGPVIMREPDGRVESRGVRVSLPWGRVRLEGHGEQPDGREGCCVVSALSGAAMMLSRAALDRVGLFDEEYFFSFEDLDWCLRAQRAGLRVGVALAARARHVGSQTIGSRSPDRLYYAARNHIRMVEKLAPRGGVPRGLRRLTILGLNLCYAVRQSEVPRWRASQAVLAGFRDACSGRYGAKGIGCIPSV
jgi:GT2 family glycosyltransferase